MNGAYTPGLMKKMTHPITKKHKASLLRKMEQDVKVVGNNRVDNVLMTNGDKQEGVIMETVPGGVMSANRDTNKIIYPEITSRDSLGIRGSYEYLKSDNPQKILNNSRSSATVEEADSYNLNKLRGYAKKYGLDAVKGVRDHYGFGPKNNN